MFTTIPRTASSLPRAHTTAVSPTPLLSVSPLSHAIVLNWEDVVVPTTLLSQRIGLRASREAMEQARNLLSHDAYLQQALAIIDEQAVALLTTAAAIGPVTVVTESSLKFIEVTCSLLFPRLAAFLLQANMPGAFAASSPQQQQRYAVRVVAPPRKFTSTTEHSSWRVSVFQSVSAEQAQRFTGCAFSLISVSATDRDSHACLAAVHKSIGVHAVPKCVQVHDAASHSLESFYAQLQTLQGYVSAVASHVTPFSTAL